MAKLKPFKVNEKRIIHQLALALTAAEIESKVIKPKIEQETQKRYQHKGGYLDTYLQSDPAVKRVWKTLQKEIQKVRADYLAYAEKDHDNT